LCAGFGKRLNPLTLNTPKPLLEINNLTLLENTINLIKYLNIKKIKLNTFYLKDKIELFIKKKNFDVDIEIIDDGNKILDTGGGIFNMIRSSPKSENHFLVFNPDTIWNQNYVKTINEMINFYFLNLNYNTLLVVNKILSFDKSLKGDFSLHKKKLTKLSKNNYIFTGCQIINRKIIGKIFLEPVYNFSILKIWNTLIVEKNLFGYESKNNFNHVTNLEIYEKLLKNN
jgi:MurNAc alpha-1-phosphate uridylyltransferase